MIPDRRLSTPRTPQAIQESGTVNYSRNRHRSASEANPKAQLLGHEDIPVSVPRRLGPKDQEAFSNVVVCCGVPWRGVATAGNAPNI